MVKVEIYKTKKQFSEKDQWFLIISLIVILLLLFYIVALGQKYDNLVFKYNNLIDYINNSCLCIAKVK